MKDTNHYRAAAKEQNRYYADEGGNRPAKTHGHANSDSDHGANDQQAQATCATLDDDFVWTQASRSR
jgi:hypothetical protein